MNFSHYNRSPFLVYLIQNKKLKSTRCSNHRHQEEQVHRLYQFWSQSTIPHKIVVVNEQSFSNSLRPSESACMGHLGVLPVLYMQATTQCTEIYKLRKNILILFDDPSNDGTEYIALAKNGLSDWNECYSSNECQNGTHYMGGDGSKCVLLQTRTAAASFIFQLFLLLCSPRYLQQYSCRPRMVNQTYRLG